MTDMEKEPRLSGKFLITLPCTLIFYIGDNVLFKFGGGKIL